MCIPAGDMPGWCPGLFEKCYIMIAAQPLNSLIFFSNK